MGVIRGWTDVLSNSQGRVDRRLDVNSVNMRRICP